MTDFKYLIKETDAYKKLNSIQKEIIMKRQNRLVIENGYEVAKNIGVEKWEKQSNFNYRNKGIIMELIEKDV